MRRRRNLRQHMEMAVLGTGIGMNLENRTDRESKLRRGAGGRRLCVRIPASAPEDGHASDVQERGGVLGDHLGAGEGAGDDEIARVEPVSPLLGPRVHSLGVDRAARRRRALDERALASVGLDEHHSRFRQRDRKREPGKAGTSAKIGNPPGRSDSREFERDERVREVVLGDARWIANGRRRQRILRDERHEGAEASSRFVVEPVARSEARDRIPGTHDARASRWRSRSMKPA